MCEFGGPFRMIMDYPEKGYSFVYSEGRQQYGYLFHSDMAFFPQILD